MIQLVSGSTAKGIQQRLMSGESGLLESESTLICVPGDAAASCLRRHTQSPSITTLQYIKQRLCSPVPLQVLSPAEAQLIIRTQLQRNQRLLNAIFPEETASDLLESRSAINMVYRLVMQQLKIEIDDLDGEYFPAESRRFRAIETLARDFSRILEAEGLQIADAYNANSVVQSPQEQWQHLFPGITTIIMAFHERFSGLDRLLIRRVSQIGWNVVVLFPYDATTPDKRSHMAPTFDLLVDIADDQVIETDTPQLDMCPLYHLELGNQSSELNVAYNLLCRTRAVHPDGSVLIVVPDASNYRTRVVTHLQKNGVSVTSPPVGPLNNSTGQFLQLLVQWITQQNRASCRNLVNHPYYRCLLPETLKPFAAKTTGIIERILMHEMGSEIRHLTGKELSRHLDRSRPEDLPITPDEATIAVDVLEALESYRANLVSCSRPPDCFEKLTDLITRLETDTLSDDVADNSAPTIRELRTAITRIAALSSVVFEATCDLRTFIAHTLELVKGKTKTARQLQSHITVATLSETPGCSADTVIILGVIDGLIPDYPSPVPDWGFLPNNETRVAQRQYWFEQIIHGANRECWLIGFEKAEQLEALPSQFLWDNIRDSIVRVAEDELQDPSSIETRIMPPNATTWGNDIVPITHARQIAWNHSAEQTRDSANTLTVFDGVLSKPSLRKILASQFENRTWSPTRLGGLVSCPFRYWSEQILKLVPASGEPSNHAIDAGEAGTLVHETLERFFRTWTSEYNEQYITPDNFATASKLMLSTAESVLLERNLLPFPAAVIRRRLLGPGDAADFVQSAMEASRSVPEDAPPVGILGSLLIAELERFVQFEVSLAGPWRFEFSFGNTDEQNVEIRMGTESVRVRGCVDRVDISGDAVLVIDYKTGAIPSNEEILEGRAPQLPIYTAAVRQLLGDSYRAGGGLYYGLDVATTSISGRYLQKSFQPLAGISSRCKAVADDEFHQCESEVFAHMGNAIHAGKNSLMHHTLARKYVPCTFCDYSDFCRKNLPRQQQLVREALGT